MGKKGIMAACVVLVLLLAGAVAGIWYVNDYSTVREATQAEIEEYSAYALTTRQADATVQTFILSLCTAEPAEEDGTVFFTSDTLGGLLYQCETINEIYMQNGILHITYQRSDGGRVGLSYDDAGLTGLWVYDTAKDTLYQQTDDGATVTTNYYRSLRQRVE